MVIEPIFKGSIWPLNKAFNAASTAKVTASSSIEAIAFSKTPKDFSTSSVCLPQAEAIREGLILYFGMYTPYEMIPILIFYLPFPFLISGVLLLMFLLLKRLSMIILQP